MSENWPADKVERWPIGKLTPNARNARTHSDAQVEEIAASIEHFGWTIPVLVDEDGVLIAGHGRILAAEILGIVDVPVMVARGWSDAKRRAYMLADNRLPMNAAWDMNLLAAEVADLKSLGLDMTLAGFSNLELASLETIFGTQAPDADEEETPEPPADPVSRLGDLWCLGPHRLLCGDSTSAADVASCLQGHAPHLMVTDPPYGVEYDANWRNEADRANGKAYGARAVGVVKNDDQADWREAYALFPGDVAYAWSADLRSKQAIEGLQASGFEIRAQIIWAKTRLIIGRGHYHFQHEPCWYAVRKGARGHWSGDRSQTTLWTIDHAKSETGHSTQKPVECMRRPIINNSQPGERVYEPFSGSGTTIVAAQTEGRICHAIEINPAYIDVAVLRWQTFTGQEATLDGDGRTFAAVTAERKPAKPKAKRAKAPL